MDSEVYDASDGDYTSEFYAAILGALKTDPRRDQSEFRLQEIRDILLVRKVDVSRYKIRNALAKLIERKQVERTGPLESSRYRLA